MSWKVVSRKTTDAWGRQPTGKVSPTTAHWGQTSRCRWPVTGTLPSGGPEPGAAADPPHPAKPSASLASPGAPPPEPGPSPGRAGAPRGGTSLGGRGQLGWGRGLLGKRAPSPAPAPRSRAGRGRTLVGVGLADALGRLEGVEGVGEVHVRVRLVHQPVQHVHGFHDRHSFVGEAPELGMLGQDGTGQLGPGRGPGRSLSAPLEPWPRSRPVPSS